MYKTEGVHQLTVRRVSFDLFNNDSRIVTVRYRETPHNLRTPILAGDRRH